jgi:hypothetical protein
MLQAKLNRSFLTLQAKFNRSFYVLQAKFREVPHTVGVVQQKRLDPAAQVHRSVPIL